MKSDVWMSFSSVQNWNESAMWNEFFPQMEVLLSDRIAKLDDKDPIRRKVESSNAEGDFITKFGLKEDSRWIYGKFTRSKIQFEIQFYKEGMDSFGRLRDNDFNVFIPHQMSFEPDAEKLIKVFRLCAEILRPFYAYADFKDEICSKKPCTPSLDISRELMGIFWLTYLGRDYRTYFSETLTRVENAGAGPNEGVIIQLGTTPLQVDVGLRERVQQQLGSKSFASGGLTKEPGQFALTLQQIRSSFAPELPSSK